MCVKSYLRRVSFNCCRDGKRKHRNRKTKVRTRQKHKWVQRRMKERIWAIWKVEIGIYGCGWWKCNSNEKQTRIWRSIKAWHDKITDSRIINAYLMRRSQRNSFKTPKSLREDALSIIKSWMRTRRDRSRFHFNFILTSWWDSLKTLIFVYFNGSKLIWLFMVSRGIWAWIWKHRNLLRIALLSFR